MIPYNSPDLPTDETSASATKRRLADRRKKRAKVATSLIENYNVHPLDVSFRVPIGQEGTPPQTGIGRSLLGVWSPLSEPR